MQAEIIYYLCAYFFIILFSFLLLPRGLYKTGLLKRQSFPTRLNHYGISRTELYSPLHAC